MAQFTLKRLMLAVAFVAVAMAILAQSIHSGEYASMHDPELVSFLMTHPHFNASLGAAIGAIFGRVGLGVAIALAIQILAWFVAFFLVVC